MKTKLQLILVTLGLAALSAAAQVPGIISHQGKVTVNGTNWTGSGAFKFAVVNAAGTTTYWSNDGTGTGGAEPTSAVTLATTRGVFSVNLGDTAVANMTQAIPASVFTNNGVFLRVWFNDGPDGSQLLAPDRQITSVGYAMVAGSYAETDPLFAASIASGISSGQTNNWNTAYGWGNHATAGYLTNFTETEPLFTNSVAAGITSGQTNNWNTAYGWGNHASAGYLTSFTETDPLFAASAAHGIASGDITAWNAKVGGVTASLPLASSGGTTPNLTIQTASGSQAGALSSADWATFNNKVGGSGTASYVPKFTASGTVGNSPISISGTNVGVGTTTPTNALSVVGSVQIVDGSQAANRVLTCDANGKATWTVNVSVTPSVIGTLSGTAYTDSNTSGQYTGTYITLPPGKWSVQVSMLAENSSWSGWIRSGFSSSSSSNTPTPDAIGANSASGFKNASVYAMVTGTIIINNTSGSSKTYYYWSGFMYTSSGTFSLSNFGTSLWGEDQLVAYPMN